MPTLNDLKSGETAMIKEILDLDAATQAIRMGIAAGETITCIAKVPAGPTVVQHGGMELALGRDLCQKIEVVRQ